MHLLVVNYQSRSWLEVQFKIVPMKQGLVWMPPRYPLLKGALLTLLVSANWLALYVVNETRYITPTGLILSMLVGALVAVCYLKTIADHRSP
jgi:hypothetical protein